MLLVGCADPGAFGDGRVPDPDATVDHRSLRDAFGPPGEQPPPYLGDPVVYAHSASDLYQINPDTLAVQRVGSFKWPGLGDEMTDIALDRQGHMIGISFTDVYAIDPRTAACTLLSTLDIGGAAFNGLSFIAPEIAEGKEYLMASSISGLVYELDPATGKSKQVGGFGGPGSSGDLVSVKGLGTFATVKQNAGDLESRDWLARIDTLTGRATLIGDTGFTDIWGLGFWKDKFFGFTERAQFILIDVKTGKATQVSAGAVPWWGAGVTTQAPVID
jgi:hypothetical protein